MPNAIPLSWDNFKSTVFVPGEKRVHRMSESPQIDVYGDGTSNRVGIALEVPPHVVVPRSASRLASIDVRITPLLGRHLLEVSTARPALHHEFYHVVMAISERILLHSQDPVEALGAELEAFSLLLAEDALLTTEREVGLLGELLFLRALTSRYGDRMLDSWTGPDAEPHDFRSGDHEFEVKTTLTPRRIHTINGAEQCVPSAGCQLWLVSVLLGPPGGQSAFSLAGIVTDLAATFASNRRRAAQFEALLAQCDLPSEEVPQYSREFALRRPIAVVPVDGSCPVISRSLVQSVLGPLASRVDRLHYDVNLEGLEHEEGTMTFEAALNVMSQS